MDQGEKTGFSFTITIFFFHEIRKCMWFIFKAATPMVFEYFPFVCQTSRQSYWKSAILQSVAVTKSAITGIAHPMEPHPSQSRYELYVIQRHREGGT